MKELPKQFKLKNGDDPKVREILHENGCRWYTGFPLMDRTLSAKYMFVDCASVRWSEGLDWYNGSKFPEIDLLAYFNEPAKPEKEEMQKGQLKYKGTVREWTGSIKQWKEHNEFITHWCNGGEVEFSSQMGWLYTENPNFQADIEYRKKQRKPQFGEVWAIKETGGEPCLISKSADGELMFTPLSGTTRSALADVTPVNLFEYAAPSVKEYYAQLLSDKT